MKAAGLFFWFSALCTATYRTVDADTTVKRFTWIPEWEAEVKPHGQKISVQGTVQDVKRELVSLNPKWNEDFGIIKLVTEILPYDPHAKRSQSHRIGNVDCGSRWDYCDANAVVEARRLLSSFPGRPKNQPGPNQCGLVSCCNNAAIWWCNEDSVAKPMIPFKGLADGIYAIESTCYRSGIDGGRFVGGQVSSSEKWSIIIRREACDR